MRGRRPLEYFGEGARPLVYFLEGAWFFSSLHDMGRAPSPKYPRGRAPSPKYSRGHAPSLKYSRGRDAREEDRALVWEEPGPEDDPDSVPGLHSLPLLTGTRPNWSQGGRAGREGSIVSLQAKYLAITATSSLSWAGRGCLQSGWQLWYSFFNDKLKFKNFFLFFINLQKCKQFSKKPDMMM